MVEYAVVMAGGVGTRLWPLSREGNPKQLLRLVGGRSLFQLTLERLKPIFSPEHTLIVTGGALLPGLREQAPEIPGENFIVEPSGRGTAPCIGLAAVHVMHRDPGAVMVVVPADHHVSDVGGFHRAIRAGLSVAEAGPLVTLGIQPTYPATGYGYIKQGDLIGEHEGLRVHRVDRFVEKPNGDAAAGMILEGGYSWNSGMFVWKAERIMEEFAIHMPGLWMPLDVISRSLDSDTYDKALGDVWVEVPVETIDYGVMEKTEDVAVIPVSIGWSDIGSWSSLKELYGGDEQGNTLRGNNILLDSSGSMVVGGKRLIAVVGLKNVLVVDTDDALLVCRLRDDQRVKDVVNLLKAGKRKGLL